MISTILMTSMSERRFVLVDFTHMNSAGCLTVYEAGGTCTLPRVVAHAAAKQGLVARERPADWSPPSMLKLPEALTEADVVEAEAELRALQRHSLEVLTRRQTTNDAVCRARSIGRRDRRSANV